MNIKLLSHIVLITCSLSVSAATQTKMSSPADSGVINEASILYWLEKRGELEPNASEEKKQQAIKAYLGNKSFKGRKIPGVFSKHFMLEQQAGFNSNNVRLKRKKFQKKNKFAVQAAPQITETKVLAILIDFEDHTANQTTYSVSHYTDLLFSNATGDGEVKSAYQYYQRESGGTLNFTGVVNGWVRADNNAAHYGGNDADDDDKDVPALVLEAVTKAVAELNVDLREYDQTDLSDIDGDGNLQEPDGIIDHVMIFHSSIGEEAGGGTLGADAIWSHRYFVVDDNYTPADIPGSDIKLFGYTITPIDARVGVVVHEFGHDLGLPDEYDTASGKFGSPVAEWSLMASGTWVDDGSHPSGFSPFAKDYYQQRYGGNWINQQVIELDELNSETIALVAATNHEEGNINQIKVNLPTPATVFAPYTGDYQFYSTAEDNLNASMSFEVIVPSGESQLDLKAHWEIEDDYDYILVSVDDVAIAGNHTKIDNPEHSTVYHYISGNSTSIDGAEGDMGWVNLSYNLSPYANQTVTIKISYVTDAYVGGYGFVADDISVNNGGDTVFSHGAETTDNMLLAGFTRPTQWSVDGAAHNYYVQLRDHTSTDAHLDDESYDAGVVVWYRNQKITNNQVNKHPGEVFLGVVDADQVAIKSGSTIRSTSIQLRDAAFSQFDQSTFSNDNHLLANNMFNDKLDYSTPYQPESGVITPIFGLSIEVADQATDNSTASISILKSDKALINADHNGLSVSFSVVDEDLASDAIFTWQLGDNTMLTGSSIQHSYAQVGEFTVTVTYQANSGEKILTSSIIVGEAVAGEFIASASSTNNKSVTFVPTLAGGEGDITYRWNFGDDSDIATSKSATHTYETYGTFDVTLTVVDDTRQKFIFTNTVTVDNSLEGDFSFTKNYLEVSFTSVASGGDENYRYAWNFGDNSTSIEANPIHTYSAAGNYKVLYTVTDGAGTSITKEETLTVSAQVVTPPVTKSTSSGGSFSLWSLLLFGVLLTRKVINQVK